MPSRVPHNNMVKRTEFKKRLGVRTAISTYQVMGHFGQVGDTENSRMAHPIAMKLCRNVLTCIAKEITKFELAKVSCF